MSMNGSKNMNGLSETNTIGYYAPSDCLLGLGVFVGVSLTYSPPSFTSLTGSPVFVIEDSSRML